MTCAACRRSIDGLWKAKYRLCFDCWQMAGEPKDFEDLLKSQLVDEVLRREGAYVGR